ncbi:hypothetical protein EVAR_62832_1 [Eumeta japonica]|uniref:Uncharacterized protein n=1 Tax=Eumeta variegata TaxID=151549 RepID=A0A4C1ZHK8_EUMVA|nr:hypothetical protein EVAR_62832_1 [Eumeta japonica]
MGVGHRNSHSLDEMQQRKLLLNVRIMSELGSEAAGARENDDTRHVTNNANGSVNGRYGAGPAPGGFDPEDPLPRPGHATYIYELSSISELFPIQRELQRERDKDREMLQHPFRISGGVRLADRLTQGLDITGAGTRRFVLSKGRRYGRRGAGARARAVAHRPSSSCADSLCSLRNLGRGVHVLERSDVDFASKFHRYRINYNKWGTTVIRSEQQQADSPLVLVYSVATVEAYLRSRLRRSTLLLHVSDGRASAFATCGRIVFIMWYLECARHKGFTAPASFLIDVILDFDV